MSGLKGLEVGAEPSHQDDSKDDILKKWILIDIYSCEVMKQILSGTLMLARQLGEDAIIIAMKVRRRCGKAEDRLTICMAVCLAGAITIDLIKFQSLPTRLQIMLFLISGGTRIKMGYVQAITLPGNSEDLLQGLSCGLPRAPCTEQGLAERPQAHTMELLSDGVTRQDQNVLFLSTLVTDEEEED
ncbi:hypothetical protein llap_9373 [Limosa lapponica baueri]|uniref:Uncharacterized protein n=1 Tax=Limosa lapponica baueri TaxID=1758121 RepID=A0A2I0U2S1_LIMLA|nr:hypothetical protein llap_9373 [Limosa lapponica baueri]